ncbi:MAG: LysR family transcriptional regulator [Bacillota bacterium]|nr:LysR family transcriptional regulator [Bacillota bacterium]
MIDINQLQYFIACAQKKSLSEAAEALYTSQPHVSMVIKSLEKEVGKPLFHRTARGVILTEEGESVYHYAQNVLKNLDLMVSTLHDHEQRVFSVISNHSSKTAELLSEFYHLHENENIHFRFMEGETEDIIEQVNSRKAEMGLVYAAQNQKTAFGQKLQQNKMEFILLRATDVVLCAGPHSPFYHQETVTVQDLRQIRFVQTPSDYFSFYDFMNSQSKDGKAITGLNRTVITNSDHTMVRLLQKTSLGNLGSYWMKKDTEQQNIHVIPVEGFQGQVAFGYIKRKDEPLSPLADSLVRMIHERLQEIP